MEKPSSLANQALFTLVFRPSFSSGLQRYNLFFAPGKKKLKFFSRPLLACPLKTFRSSFLRCLSRLHLKRAAKIPPPVALWQVGRQIFFPPRSARCSGGGRGFSRSLSGYPQKAAASSYRLLSGFSQPAFRMGRVRIGRAKVAGHFFLCKPPPHSF